MNAAGFVAWLRSMRARATEMFRRRRLDDERDEEIRFHLALEIEHNERLGMSAAEARRVALTAFGGVQRFAEEASERRGFVAIDNIARDIRFAIRRLRRAPVFAIGVIATMAIGVASAVGIGTLVFDVLLRPLPYAHPETLARILIHAPGLGTTSTESSGGLFVLVRERSRSFSALGSYYQSEGVTITGGDRPQRVTSAMISPSVLEMVGVRPAAGRLFVDDDARTKPVPVMISHVVWVERFGGDPGIAGKTIELNRGPRTIIGVLPRGFDFPSASVSIWYPDAISATRAGLNFRYFNVIGRLHPGVSTAAAEAEIRILLSHLPDRFPETSAEAVRASALTASVRTLQDEIVAPVRAQLVLLAIMVAVVLLIATANVATLCLLRADRMRTEIAISKALGASRGALAQRFVTEGLVIGVAGGIVALPLIGAMLLTKFGFSEAQIPRLHEVTLAPGTFGVLAMTVVVIGAALGLIAAARASGSARWELGGARTATRDRRWRRAQRGLVVTQVAFSLALLLGAALMAQSLWQLSRVDIGFNARRTMTFQLGLPFQPYPRYGHSAAFHLAVMAAVRSLPGVSSVTASMGLPFDPDPPAMRRIATVGEASVRETSARPSMAPPNYFQTMGIPLHAGRSFADGDLVSEHPAVVISASLAKEMFGSENAVGREIRIQDPMEYPTYRVIGVVGDVFGDRIQAGVVPTFYFPLLADIPVTPIDPAVPYRPRIPYNPGGMTFVVRGDVEGATLLPAIRRVVSDVDPKVPVSKISSLAEITAHAVAPVRLTMLLLAIGATAALVISAIGLYSVIAYAVAGRSREFGVRLALGSTPSAIIALVLRDGLTLVSLGVAAGIAAALAESGLVRGMLYQVSATNPVAYAASALVIILTSLVATYVPARHAGLTDPALTLRGE